jgi:hypothetical protein
MKEMYGDILISDILNNSDTDDKKNWVEKEVQNYICLEDQFDYCFRKNVTI